MCTYKKLLRGESRLSFIDIPRSLSNYNQNRYEDYPQSLLIPRTSQTTIHGWKQTIFASILLSLHIVHISSFKTNVHEINRNNYYNQINDDIFENNDAYNGFRNPQNTDPSLSLTNSTTLPHTLTTPANTVFMLDSGKKSRDSSYILLEEQDSLKLSLVVFQALVVFCTRVSTLIKNC